MYFHIMAITSSMLTLSLVSLMLSLFFLMMCLLSLEFFVPSALMSMMIIMSINNQNISPSFFMLILGACEASLALSLLINLTRFKGNDMHTNNSIKC